MKLMAKASISSKMAGIEMKMAAKAERNEEIINRNNGSWRTINEAAAIIEMKA
jgi:hypothetical protein